MDEVGRDKWLSIYTDGSKQVDRVKGIVCLAILGIRIAFQLTDQCNVFQAENRVIKEILLVLSKVW